MDRERQNKEKRKEADRKRNGTPCWLLVVMLIVDLCLIGIAGRCLYHFFHDPGDAQAFSKASQTAEMREQNEEGRINWIEEDEANRKEGRSMDGKNGLTEKCRQLYEKYEDLLILVNKEHALPEDYKVALKTLDNGKVSVASAMYEDLKLMLADASCEGGYSYSLISGYRDREYQQKLILNDVRKYMKENGLTADEALEKTYEQVMPAGYSEHETGLALDITDVGNTELDETQGDEPAIRWLHENCWKYGFILRYPKEKEDITQISYEPWHFRYVGRDAAEFLYVNGLTLEEFYEYL